jgi:hypothetical protein
MPLIESSQLKNRFLLSLILLFFLSMSNVHGLKAQKISQAVGDSALEKPKTRSTDFRNQRDLIDIALKIIHKNPASRLDTTGKKTRKIHFSGSPSLEYSLTTGFAVTAYGNFAYYTHEDDTTNLSSFLVGVGYTQKSQYYTPIQSTIWTRDNTFNFLGDWRFYHFPENTYGFGGFTTEADGYIVDYNQLRFYETALKHIRKNFFIGIGIQIDHHWGIKEQLDSTIHIPTDFEKYGFNTSSTSSGLSLDILYDSRKNSINPEGGAQYANLVFRQNLTFLGSNTNWNSLLIDLRKYFSIGSENVLGFWSYNYFTLSGNPPYLDLPGTATDTYSNTGRGYVQSRFIGKKMIYLETEFRYGILRNGLLGGVVFLNAESQSELNSNQFQTINPGFGGGLRIKFNKFSRTNICLDYGKGLKGSGGVFANLGEVF